MIPSRLQRRLRQRFVVEAANPKFEYRDKLKMRNSKAQNRFGHWHFEFWICLRFRAWDFGFPVAGAQDKPFRTNRAGHLAAAVSGKKTSPFLKVTLFSCMIVAFLATAAFPQRVLTLEETLNLVRQNNLQLRQQDAAERIAMLEEAIRKSDRLPALDLSINTVYTSRVNVIDLQDRLGVPGLRVELGSRDRTEMVLNLNQPLFTGFRLQSLESLARNSTMDEQTREQILFNEICYRVYALVYAGQRITNQTGIFAASVRRLEIQLRNIRNFYEAGQVLAFDTLQVYNQKLSVNIELENTRLAKRLNDLRLAQLLNLHERVEVAPLTLGKPESDQKQVYDEVIRQAHAKRPELISMNLARQRINLQRKIAQANYLPSIYAQGAFHYAKPGLDPVSNEWMNYFSAGLALQWNLWRWHGDRHKVEQLQIAGNRWSLQEQQLLNDIEFEVRESLENLSFSLDQLRLAENLHAQQAERYRMVSTQQQNGQASTNDVVTAETDLTRAELQKEQALVQYYLNLAGLQRATGTIGEF
jgi:outer membrane protein TolC